MKSEGKDFGFPLSSLNEDRLQEKNSKVQLYAAVASWLCSLETALKRVERSNQRSVAPEVSHGEIWAITSAAGKSLPVYTHVTEMELYEAESWIVSRAKCD